jgi:hypothetical protein
MKRVIWLGPVLVRLEIGPPSSSHIVTVAAVLLPTAMAKRIAGERVLERCVVAAYFAVVLLHDWATFGIA